MQIITCGMCKRGPYIGAAKTVQCQATSSFRRVEDITPACALFLNREQSCRYCKNPLTIGETVKDKGICTTCERKQEMLHTRKESYFSKFIRKLTGRL